jgi:ankyrin repeat protein
MTDTDTESTPLILAASKFDSIQIMRMLLNSGADIDGEDPDGRTALWWATFSGQKENAKFLIEAGADKSLDYNKDLGF